MFAKCGGGPSTFRLASYPASTLYIIKLYTRPEHPIHTKHYFLILINQFIAGLGVVESEGVITLCLCCSGPPALLLLLFLSHYLEFFLYGGIALRGRRKNYVFYTLGNYILYHFYVHFEHIHTVYANLIRVCCTFYY